MLIFASRLQCHELYSVTTLAVACSYNHVPSQQTQNILKLFIQRPSTVFDCGPPLYKCYTNVVKHLYINVIPFIQRRPNVFDVGPPL